MAEAAIGENGVTGAEVAGHAWWVRACHWTVAAGLVTLAFSGLLILMVHPRLYWGEVGNDLTPALIELPISGNHRPAGWERTTDFAAGAFSADRTYEIFNQNGWARSLHFLAAWIFAIAWLVYAAVGLAGGHIRHNLLPRLAELRLAALGQDVVRHLRRQLADSGGGRPYGLLQRLSYAAVVIVLLPFMILTGLTMAPAVTAAYPVLLDLFDGYQSARTLHFFGFALLMLFFVVHLTMVFLTGFRRQLRAMTLGG